MHVSVIESAYVVTGVVVLAVVCAAAPEVAQRQSEDAVARQIRELQLTIEHASSLSAEIRLTIQRAGAVQTRIETLSWELADVRSQVARASTEITRSTAYLRQVDGVLQSTGTPMYPTLAFFDQYNAAKAQVEGQTELWQQMKNRESQVTAALKAEEARSSEVNRRLEDLGRKVESSK